MGDSVPHTPCQRDTIPLESHFSTNDSIVWAENRFSALFVYEHGSYLESFAQAFSKACRFLGQRPKSRSAERETPPLLPKDQEGGWGNPIKGFPQGFPKGRCPFGRHPQMPKLSYNHVIRMKRISPYGYSKKRHKWHSFCMSFTPFCFQGKPLVGVSPL